MGAWGCPRLSKGPASEKCAVRFDLLRAGWNRMLRLVLTRRLRQAFRKDGWGGARAGIRLPILSSFVDVQVADFVFGSVTI